MFDLNANPHEHPFLFNSGTEQITSDTSHDTWQAMNYASRAQKTAHNYANYRSWNSMGARINEGASTDDDEYDSGVRSPPLWETASRVNNYRSLSPASRTQAIARGQREMMEMVKNMPESCYELSLKDLVEHKKPMVDEEDDRDQNEEEDDKSTQVLVRRGNLNEEGNYKKKKSEKKKFVMRSGSIDSGGFLLKMVFPISLGLNKKNMNKINSNNNNNNNKMKKSDSVVVGANSNNTTSAKVSPKPQGQGHGQGVDGSVKGGVESEWWKMKRLSVSERSESGVSSINSGSMKSSGSSSISSSSTRSISSSSRRKKGGCWSFIMLKKNKRRD
ncbi:hypothetical protein L3X38_040917 [Prunus dulcis]|uniref:Uncharacterized protein n=1 Tax=Prunus dulcis TaxID=3755 RepID=A0AAD4URZ0_PRUDU|nr:hypothetical protein L3X38_040917 [Prunus dulcis]